MQSVANPPRHAIVRSASNNKPFLAALSRDVLKSCAAGYQYPALVSLWASTTAEAIATMVDQAQSTKREAQGKNQEDVLMFILPILNDGLSTKDALDLQVGCYMILTVLACKANLEENVLTAMMEAVVSNWHGASHAGLICLAVLAQQRQQLKLPRNVLNAVWSISSLDHDLTILNKEYQVDRLVCGIVTGMLKRITKAGDTKDLPQIRRLFESRLMLEPSFYTAVNAMLVMIDQPISNEQQVSDAQDSLSDLVLRLSDSQSVGTQIRDAIKVCKLRLGHLRPRLQGITERLESEPPMLEGLQARSTEGQDTANDFNVIAGGIPTGTAYEISFLSHSESYIYNSLVEAFCSVHTSDANLERFTNLPVLRKPLAMSEPLFISFYIRLWCGRSPATARAASLRSVARYLEDNTWANDLQILLPYVIYALSDSSLLVRRAAARLILILSNTHLEAAEKTEEPSNETVLGRAQIYGQNEQSHSVKWLSVKESTRFVADLLVPNLEECLMDDQAVSHLLSVSITGSQSSKGPHIKAYTDLKTSLRLSIFSFLCSHVVHSPLYTFKLRMLQILNKIERVGSTSRTKLLLPLLSAAAKLGHERLLRICQREQIDISAFLHELTGTVTSNDREGIQYLGQIANTAGFELFQVAAMHRVSTIWPHLKADLQLSLATVLLDLAICRDPDKNSEVPQTKAMETLQTIRLSTATLQHLLTHLPLLSNHPQDKSAAAKRRRMSHGHLKSNSNAGEQSRIQDIRSITIVLEMIESSQEDQHPSLVKGLFQVLMDLKDAQSQSGNATSYLQILAMDSMLAIVKKAKQAPKLPLDASVVRMDVLIDYIRTSKNPQVRNIAFLLVAGIADVAPELVLHSVMPIFTYMGANLLRQEDDFSAYVVQQTMESVIPRLVQSLHSGSNPAFAGVCELLLYFAAAFEHIPQQRRLDIFSSLVVKVGAIDHLFALLAILSDKYPGNRRILDLCTQLFAYQHILIQLQTMEKYLKVVLDAWNPTPSGLPNPLLLDPCHSAEAITTNLLPLAVATFRSEPLLFRISKRITEQNDDAAVIRALIAKIFDYVFQLSQICGNDVKLDLLCTQLLNSSFDLLPIQELVHTLEGLMSRADNNLSRKVLQSFEHRLNTQKVGEHVRESSLAFVPRLITTIQESTALELKQAAVSTIQRIVETFGKTNLPRVVEAGRCISAEMCLGAENVTLCISSLLCLSKMIEAAGETIVPILPLALPMVGKNLEVGISEDTEDRSLHNACYSVFQALLLYVPWMITGADLDRILTLSYKSANAAMGFDCDRTREGALQLIARQIEVKELFASLERTWAIAVIEGPKAVNDYFEVLRLAIAQQPKSVVKQQSEALGDIFRKAFSLRQAQLCPRTNDSYNDEEIEEAEAAINDTAIAMIYKLNDASFRPLFQRIMEWAISSTEDKQGKIYRQISWYTFLHHFFGTLKSIVTSYAGYIIEDAVELLQAARLENEDSVQLWRRVMQTLQSTLEHDQDGEQSSNSMILVKNTNGSWKVFTKLHPVSHQSPVHYCLSCPRRLVSL